MPKRVAEDQVLQAIVRAKENEGKFVDAAAELFRRQFAAAMPKIRSHALLAESYRAKLTVDVVVSFQPLRERISMSVTGAVTSSFQSSGEDSVIE